MCEGILFEGHMHAHLLQQLAITSMFSHNNYIQVSRVHKATI